MAFHIAANASGAVAQIQDLLKCPIPKTIRKPPSGVRTSSPATNGIAAFAVTASCTRRRYANTLLITTTKPCRRACTSTSTAQFGSERNSHDHALNVARTSVKTTFPPQPTESGLLRAHRERRHGRRAADKRDELAPFHRTVPPVLLNKE